MNQSITRLSLLALCAVAIAAAPVSLQAQSTNKHASAEKKAAKAAKSSTVPFHGKLKSVDKMAKTIAIGESVIQITSETKISKDEKPAILDDGVVGETVSGAYNKTDDGKLMATMVHFGAKAEKEAKPAKTTKAKKADATENKM